MFINVGMGGSLTLPIGGDWRGPHRLTCVYVDIAERVAGEGGGREAPSGTTMLGAASLSSSSSLSRSLRIG